MIPEQPESFRHGDAWRAFCETWHKALAETRPTAEPQSQRTAWLFFLAGWLGKARQADELRGKR